MAGLGNGQNAFRKVNIAPLQGDKFADTQTTVKAEKNAVQFIFLAIQYDFLYLLLLGKGKTLHGLFFQFRAFELICRVFLCQSQKVRRFKRTLNNRDDSVHTIG